MNLFDDIESYVAVPSAVTVGVFDGLHLGHQSLIRELVSEAKSRDLTSVVVTFDPHPRIVLSKGNDRVGLLTTVAERAKALEQCGVDRVIVLPFTRSFSDLTARQFLSEWLCEKIGAQFILLGYNHHFGSDEVPEDDYLAFAKSAGIDVRRSSALSLPGGAKISSTEVRHALESGSVERASLLLGRHYSLCGTVVHGDAIGRSLGYPTANVEPDSDLKLVPADGVYAAKVTLDEGEPLPAIVNVGFRPTMGGQGRRVEAHLLDFDGDLYGRDAQVSFVSRLRDERKFDDANSLQKQIAQDVAAARDILARLDVR